MKSDEEIIRIAHMMHAVDNGADPTEFRGALDTMDAGDHSVMRLATKLIEGKPFQVVSDNPESIRRHRSVAKVLGATEGLPQTSFDGRSEHVVFNPPLRA